MNEIWQLWSGVLDDPTVHKIITECEYYEPQNANLGFGGDNTDNQVRRSEVRWVDRNDPNSRFIADLIWNFAEEANRDVFGFDITLIRDIQYTIYKAQDLGKYDWHFDTFWANPKTTDRKISVIIQLSDPDDYEGGDFEIDPQYVQPEGIRQKGSIFVFPSFLRHRVTEVTKGTRKSLVSWIEGPKFR